MNEKCIFNCETCGKEIELDKDEKNIPECCGKVMTEAEPLPACELSTTAEHARLANPDEPCDDGRGGNV